MIVTTKKCHVIRDTLLARSQRTHRWKAKLVVARGGAGRGASSFREYLRNWRHALRIPNESPWFVLLVVLFGFPAVAIRKGGLGFAGGVGLASEQDHDTSGGFRRRDLPQQVCHIGFGQLIQSSE